MLWIKAFHIIFVICWFAGLFYVPRLFVYHADASDDISIERFKIMERRLYYGITTPAGILTTVFGMWLLIHLYVVYGGMMWIHIKLALVVVLWAYHIYLGFCVRAFKLDKNKHSSKFYRWLNEVPTILLLAIVILTVIQPF